MVSGCVCKLSKSINIYIYIYDLTRLAWQARRQNEGLLEKGRFFLQENRCFDKEYVKDGTFKMDRPFQRFWKFSVRIKPSYFDSQRFHGHGDGTIVVIDVIGIVRTFPHVYWHEAIIEVHLLGQEDS